MATLANHVTISITRDSVGITKAGFGTLLLLSPFATFPERVRSYNSLLDVASDFATDTPEYLAATVYFGQNPKPPVLKIGRQALKHTQVYTFSVASATNSTLYSIDVQGEGITRVDATYTSDSAATVAEIHNGLLTALNAVASNNYTAAFAALVIPDDTFTAATTDICTATAHGLVTGDGPVQLTTTTTLPAGLSLATDYWIIRLTDDTFSFATSLANALAGTAVDITDTGTGTHTLSDTASTVRPSGTVTVTGDAAGDWFSLGATPASGIAITQTHTDAGVATDLAAIALEDNDWYALYTFQNSNAVALATAAWCEANEKLYLMDSSDTNCVTAILTGSDTIDDLHTLMYAYTIASYHPRAGSMFGAGWAGRVLPIDPGGDTWKFKTIAGVEPVVLTSTQRTNLTNKKGNSYETVAGRNITFDGTTTDGDYADVTRFLSWFKDDAAKEVFGSLAGNDKLPYTEAGVAVLKNDMWGSVTRGVTRGGFADDPAPLVTSTPIADISTSDRAIRKIYLSASATLAGAIHKVAMTAVVSI